MLPLLIYERRELTTIIPEVVKQVLEQFHDITLVELLEHLPPMRAQQCQIDLILGSILPNLPYQ